MTRREGWEPEEGLQDVEGALAALEFETPPLRTLWVPRARRTWIPMRLAVRPIAVAAALVIAAGLLAISTRPGAVGPTVAFVGWQPIPGVADSTLASGAIPECHAADAELVAQDQRGNAATLLFASGRELTLCLAVEDSSGTIVAAASGGTHLGTQSGALSVDTGMSVPANPGWPGLRILAGRTSGAVATVTVTRSDGVEITATVRSGYFVAWWPSDIPGATVTARGASGTVIEVAPAFE